MFEGGSKIQNITESHNDRCLNEIHIHYLKLLYKNIDVSVRILPSLVDIKMTNKYKN